MTFFEFWLIFFNNLQAASDVMLRLVKFKALMVYWLPSLVSVCGRLFDEVVA